MHFLVDSPYLGNIRRETETFNCVMRRFIEVNSILQSSKGHSIRAGHGVWMPYT